MVVKNWKEFWAHGVGAMMWTNVDGYRGLLVRVPDDDGGASNIVIYPKHESKNWAAPGPTAGWDGNEQHPTFKPSIDCSKHGSWHGFIVRGQLCADQQGRVVQYP